MTHRNNLTEAQTERLDKLIEECSETIQRALKVKNYGYESHHPSNPKINNRTLLENELGDIVSIINLMSEKEDIDNNRIQKRAELKKFDYAVYMYCKENKGDEQN